MTEHKVPNSVTYKGYIPCGPFMSANYFRHTDREPHKALFACGSHDRVDTEVLLYHDQTELEKKRKNQTIFVL